jgi:hypothetical protein
MKDLANKSVPELEAWLEDRWLEKDTRLEVRALFSVSLYMYARMNVSKPLMRAGFLPRQVLRHAGACSGGPHALAHVHVRLDHIHCELRHRCLHLASAWLLGMYMYICMYACACACVCNTCICLCMYVSVYVYVCVCVCIHPMHIPRYVHVFVCMHMCMHTYTCIRAHTKQETRCTLDTNKTQ